MPKWEESVQTGTDNDWHGTEMYRDQSGNEMRIGQTPNGREIYIKHASGTHIHINDKGEIAMKAMGQSSEVYLKGKNIHVTGPMHFVCKDDVTFTAEKQLNFEGKSISLKSTGGNINLKADGGGNITMESANFTKSTKENTDDKTGGRYARTVGGDSNETVQGDRQVTAKNNTQTVNGDNTSMTGGEHSISAAGTLGLGAAEVGIASTGQTTINAVGGNLTLNTGATGTFEASGKLQQKGSSVSLAGATYIGQSDLGDTSGPKIETESGPAQKAYAKV